MGTDLLAITLLLNINQAHSDIVIYHVNDHHRLLDTSNMIIHHVTKHKLTQTGSMNMTMTSVYFRGLLRHLI